MSNELATTEALEGEYISAGEPDHNERAESYQKMRDAMERQQQAFGQAQANPQIDALRQQQDAFGQAAFGLGGLGALGGGLFGFK